MKPKYLKEAEAAIEKALKELESLPADSDRYKEIVKNVVELNKLLGNSKNIDPNTVLTVSGYLVAMLGVICYERVGVIATKAFGMIFRPRI